MKSERACITCSKQKRKCSRDLPACALCQKLERTCQYIAEDASMRLKHQNSLTSERRRTNFPALFFLDTYIFKRRDHRYQWPDTLLPLEFLEQVRDSATAQHYADLYFISIHTSFPIVSKRNLYRQLSNAEYGLSADTTLLVIAMKLHCAQSDEAGEVYAVAKRCYAYMEANAIVSVKVLQAYLLVGLYEIAHAIYPAAYLTIGGCSRLGHALGIHDRKRAAQLMPTVDSWTESEEINRTWWGVIILDRFVNIGTDHHPFACQDARLHDLLPMDEDSWERGEPAISASLAASISALPVSPYARSCQASHLLSRVLTHIDERIIEVEYHYSQALQIHRTLRSFSTGITQQLESTQQTQLYTAAAICYSAEVAIYDNYSCAVLDDVGGVGIAVQLEMQEIALSRLREVCATVHLFGRQIAETIRAKGFLNISPLLADCLYQATRQMIWYVHDVGSSPDIEKLVDDNTETLQMLGRKWEVANQYLSILEAEKGHFDGV